MEGRELGGGTVNPETPLQGLIRSHNTTQASMASQIGLCAIADAATALGYHNSPSSAIGRVLVQFVQRPDDHRFRAGVPADHGQRLRHLGRERRGLHADRHDPRDRQER